MHRWIVTLSLSLAMPGIAVAQAPADDPATIVAATRAAIAERYVLPDTAAKLSAALAAPERYRGLSGDALAERINADLHMVSADKHLGIRYDPKMAAMLGNQPLPDDDAAMPPVMARMIARQNGGVRAMEVLPGNVRMIAYDGFAWGTPEAEAAIVGAMQFLRGGDAYIIDLRRNGGGSPGAVAALASYFVAEGTPLMRFEMRGRPGEATTAPRAPFSLAGKPLYVLTSGGTASAAEEFATHVSALGFGTLVGERTAGAGFRNDLLPVGKNYVLSVSSGRAISVKTGRDWEGVGVTPAIAVSSDRALPTAQAAAMARIATTATADDKREAERLAMFYRALATGVKSGRALGDYAGVYGDRKLIVAGDHLMSSRGSRPASVLVPVGGNVMAPEGDPLSRFRFVEQDGRIVALEVERVDGSVERAVRNAGQ